MGRHARLLAASVLAILAARPEPALARTFAEIAARFTPALPVVDGLPPIPGGLAPEGPRQADGQRAFRIYVEAARDECPEEGELGAARRELDRWLSAPASFRLRGTAGSAAFLELANRFAQRRALEPVLATGLGLIGFQTWRPDPAELAGPKNEPFDAGMRGLAEYLGRTVASLNGMQPGAEPLQLIDWKGPHSRGGTAWILGVRVGHGPRRFAIVTHVDTVGPIRDDWKPFEARLEILPFRGGQKLFLRGRGSIDDKGPTAAALHALDMLRSIYSGTALFEECSFELLADTAEETRRLIPDYFAAVGPPEAGVVLDAAWSLYAEKGSERPVFKAPAGTARPTGLHLVSLSTPDGPSNQLSDRATAVFAMPPKGLEAARKLLAGAIEAYLATDGPRARLELSVEGKQLVVTGIGSGAAHGSAPEVNKASGHNPLACLAAFTADLFRQNKIGPSAALSVPLFLSWAFGHNVFGEDHPTLLRAKDSIFIDGTTYALTRMKSGPDGSEARVDIRYALPHHGTEWDGKTFGTLTGDSHFQAIFHQLLQEFNAPLPPEVPPVSFETKTGTGPDLKDRDNPIFQSLLEAYQQVTGEPSPLLAIGGGTDAKGYPMLYAAGPNFSKELTEIFEPPVNYHGVGESAPAEDLVRSTQILVRWLAASGFASGR